MYKRVIMRSDVHLIIKVSKGVQQGIVYFNKKITLCMLNVFTIGTHAE